MAAAVAQPVSLSTASGNATAPAGSDAAAAASSKGATLPKYVSPPQTSAALDWANLATIDLSQTKTPEGKAAQAARLLESLRTAGFFHVKGYELSEAEIEEQFAIGQAFHRLPLEDKLAYTPDLDHGRFNGYRPAGRTLIDPESGLHDQVDFYNIPKPSFPQVHPPVIGDRLDTVLAFQRRLHEKVLDPLLRLLSIALQLPEDYLSRLHAYDDKTEDHSRYMRYAPYKPDEYEKLKDKWHVAGHTDLGTFTLLYRQPVAGLQIRDHETGEWKYARAQDGTFTVNSADALSFLTGGFVKSTIHRVVLPPQDQSTYERHGLLYFSRPRNDLVLSTIKDSPVLEGLSNAFEQEGLKPPTVEAWTYAKQTWQHRRRGTDQEQKARWTETVLPGHKEQLYK